MNMSREISKWNYGDYAKKNYGSHTQAIQIGDLTLFFSYDTIVGYSTPEDGTVVSENVWSVTTGQHLSFLALSNRIEYAKFSAMLENALTQRGFSIGKSFPPKLKKKRNNG